MTVSHLAKPYEIAFEHRPEYLYVEVKGIENNYEIAKRYWTEILNFQNTRHYARVLIDKKIEQGLDTQDVFRVVTEVAIMVRLGVRFAFVDQYFDGEKSEFEELVGNNRGLNLKYFDNLPSAELWLAD